MMDIEVHDGDAREPTRVCMRRSDGDVVEKAKAHRSAPLGVMPRRPHKREPSRTFPRIQDMIDRADHGTGCHTRNFVCVGRSIGIGIERHSAPGGLADLRHVIAVVNSFQLGIGDAAWLENLSPVPPKFRGHDLHDLESLHPLGMTRRRKVVSKAVRSENS